MLDVSKAPLCRRDVPGARGETETDDEAEENDPVTPSFALASDLAAVTRFYQFRLSGRLAYVTDREWACLIGCAAEEASRLATAYAIFAALLGPGRVG
jgi:hypothetical protein